METKRSFFLKLSFDFFVIHKKEMHESFHYLLSFRFYVILTQQTLFVKVNITKMFYIFTKCYVFITYLI